MPHKRYRSSLKILQQKLKFQPVVALQGARQVGKSFLLRELLKNKFKSMVYVTFDELRARKLAESSPDTFLDQYDPNELLIIDEAQKVPHIFDAVKFKVDSNRRPGMYILAGSTEFSKKFKITESLTGRMTTLRIFPLTLREALEVAEKNPSLDIIPAKSSTELITRAQLLRHLERGGMPGIFSIRSASEHHEAINDWINLTVGRDLLQIPGVKLDPFLATAILEKLAQLEDPTIGHLAKALKRDPRRIKSHIDALSLLFVLHRVDPHPSSVGQAQYFLCDVGLANYYESSFERKLQTWVLQELLTRKTELTLIKEKIYFYRTSKGSLIQFVVEHARDRATYIKIIASEKFNKNDFKLLQAMREKNLYKNTRLLCLGSMLLELKKEKIEMIPWQAFA